MKYKYSEEYSNSSGLFWGTHPGKYIVKLAEYFGSDLRGKQVLDLGAGEGKNSVYFASIGAKVTSVEISKIAIERFGLQPNFKTVKNSITILNEDVFESAFQQESYDIIIAYGVLHCLNSKDHIYAMVERIKTWTREKGFFVGVTFTDTVPPPPFQDYLDEISFLQQGELKNLFLDWNILSYEEAVITEIHPTSNQIHDHSLSRIIAQKDGQ